MALAELASELGENDEALRRWTERAIVADGPVAAAHAELRAPPRPHWRSAAGARLVNIWSKARRAAPTDQVLAIEVLAQDAALRQFLEHRPEESRAAAEEAVAAARAFMPSGRRAGHHRWDELDERVRRAVVRALFAGLQGAQFTDDPEQMLRFADELAVAATGFDDATRIGALVDGALALRFQGRNTDAADEVARGVDRSSPSCTAAIDAQGRRRVGERRALDGPGRRSSDCRSRMPRTRHPARRTSDRHAASASSFLTFWSSPGVIVARLSKDSASSAAGGNRTALSPARPSGAGHGPRAARSGPRRIRSVRAVDAALADAEAAACRRCLAEAMCRGAEALARASHRPEVARSLLDRGVDPLGRRPQRLLEAARGGCDHHGSKRHESSRVRPRRRDRRGRATMPVSRGHVELASTSVRSFPASTGHAPRPSCASLAPPPNSRGRSPKAGLPINNYVPSACTPGDVPAATAGERSIGGVSAAVNAKSPSSLPKGPAILEIAAGGVPVPQDRRTSPLQHLRQSRCSQPSRTGRPGRRRDHRAGRLERAAAPVRDQTRSDKE